MLAVSSADATLIVGIPVIIIMVVGGAFTLGGLISVNRKVTPNGGNSDRIGDVVIRAERHAESGKESSEANALAISNLREEFHGWSKAHTAEDTERFDKIDDSIAVIRSSVDRRKDGSGSNNS